MMGTVVTLSAAWLIWPQSFDLLQTQSHHEAIGRRRAETQAMDVGRLGCGLEGPRVDTDLEECHSRAKMKTLPHLKH